MANEPDRASEFDEATRRQLRHDLQIVDAVKVLVVEHYLTYGTAPSVAWLAKQIGLVP